MSEYVKVPMFTWENNWVQDEGNPRGHYELTTGVKNVLIRRDAIKVVEEVEINIDIDKGGLTMLTRITIDQEISIMTKLTVDEMEKLLNG